MHICWNPRTHVLPVNVPVGRGDGSEKKMFKLHVMLICLSRFLRGPNSQLSVINWVGIRLSRYNVFSRRLIVRAPPPPGFFLLGGFQTKNPEEEDPPWRTTSKIDQIRGLFFRGALFLRVVSLRCQWVLFLRSLGLETTPQRKTPPKGPRRVSYKQDETRTIIEMPNRFQIAIKKLSF